MKELSKTSIDYYLLPNKILCSMGGMWPIDEKSSTCSKVFAYFRVIFGITAVSSVFVPEIMAITSNWGDLNILAGVGCVLTTMTQVLFKMIYLIVRRERACKLYNELRSLWDSSNNPKESQSYHELAYWARIFTTVFYSSCMCNVFIFSSAAAVDYFKFEYDVNNTEKSRHLPFLVWYGTDISASPKFEIAFICQFISVIICAALIAGLDGSITATILHLSGQFKLINTWISNIGIEINCEPTYPKKLRTNLINAVNDVNHLLTPIIFMQILTGGIELCLSGYALLDSGTATGDLLKFISYFISLAIHLLIWCWPGEILVQESQEIGHVVYLNVPWYDLPPIYQRYLCLMIVRAQRYCSITALTFQTLCMSTLTTIFNTAASYFTLLRQMQQK